jgi:hypothetical protein
LKASRCDLTFSLIARFSFSSIVALYCTSYSSPVTSESLAFAVVETPCESKLGPLQSVPFLRA